MTKKQLIQDLKYYVLYNINKRNDRFEYVFNVLEILINNYISEFEKNLNDVTVVIDYQVLKNMLINHSDFAKFLVYCVEIISESNILDPNEIRKRFIIIYNNNFNFSQKTKKFLFSYYSINDF